MGKVVINKNKTFDNVYPFDCDFDILEISQVLSITLRFYGHTSEFYSAAQHSVIVSKIMSEKELAKIALLHDASAVVTGNLSRPLKLLLPMCTDLQRSISAIIYRQFGVDCISGEVPEAVSRVHDAVRMAEMRDLMGVEPEVNIDWIPTIKPVAAEEANKMFLSAYYDYFHSWVAYDNQ